MSQIMGICSFHSLSWKVHIAQRRLCILHFNCSNPHPVGRPHEHSTSTLQEITTSKKGIGFINIEVWPHNTVIQKVFNGLVHQIDYPETCRRCKTPQGYSHSFKHKYFCVMIVKSSSLLTINSVSFNQKVLHSLLAILHPVGDVPSVWGQFLHPHLLAPNQKRKFWVARTPGKPFQVLFSSHKLKYANKVWKQMPDFLVTGWPTEAFDAENRSKTIVTITITFTAKQTAAGKTKMGCREAVRVRVTYVKAVTEMQTRHQMQICLIMLLMRQSVPSQLLGA